MIRYSFAGVAASLQEQTLDNLCGDLNKGYLPLNPLGQNVEGVSYPLYGFKIERRRWW